MHKLALEFWYSTFRSFFNAVQDILCCGLDKVIRVRLVNAKVSAKLVFTSDVKMPDISVKAKSQ